MMSFHAEVIAAILAAGSLGLGCGWMISRVRGERRLRGSISAWETRHTGLEQQSRADVETLEARLETLGGEMRSLVARDRDADERLARSESSMHKARTDLIELNRQQAETQEHLQHLLRQRDRTIAGLQERMAGATGRAGGDRRPSARPPAATASGRSIRPAPTPGAARPAGPGAAMAERVRSIPMRPTSSRPEPAPEPGAGIAATRAAAARAAALAASVGNAARPADMLDDSLDATEFVDDVDATYVARNDELVDDTVAEVAMAHVDASADDRDEDPDEDLDDTLAEIAGAHAGGGDEALDATSDATVVMDEAQLRAVRRAGS